MTLIVAANTPESIWLLADRRLSHEGVPLKDDARKVMFLHTTDGVAILGYAGLGATAYGTEPADWMSRVLRGRNLLLEQSLGVLTNAMRQQFPRHMSQMPGMPVHNVIVPAFCEDELRLYTIEMVFAPDRKSYHFGWRRFIAKPVPAVIQTPRLAIGGSGALCLMQNRRWIRPLLRVLRANNRGQVSSGAVADHLAKLNYTVHIGTTNKSVGPCSIIAWWYKKGGGGHRCYTGTALDFNPPSLPTISNGEDIRVYVDSILPPVAEMLKAKMTGGPTKELNKDEMNANLARLPVKPDENLL